MTGFVNRAEELSRLRDLYDAQDAKLAVVYGRRRLGKTALVTRSLQGRDDAVVYQARQKTRQLQLRQFVEAAAETYPGIERIREDWEEVLGYLLERDAIVVLDEFPYLVAEDESLPSVLQAMFDHELDDSSGTVVLIGSSISMMEEAALLGDSPLYGRTSLKLDVRKLPFEGAMAFAPDDYGPAERVALWAIFGGVPYYLEEIDDESLGTAVQRTILSRHGSLHSEPDYVLQMELTEPTRYFSILEAIAGGSTGRNGIAQSTGIDYNQLSKYLDRLDRLRLVERQVPVTEQPERSKRSRYRIRDPLFRFWFRFVYGSGDRYEQLGDEAFARLVEPELADFASTAFESLCRRALWKLYDEYPIVETGQWWYQDHEVDAVALTDGDTLVAGECKFQSSPTSYDALASLEAHLDELRWTPAGGGERETELALFSRGGFADSLEEAATERANLRLYTVDDVVDALTG